MTILNQQMRKRSLNGCIRYNWLTMIATVLNGYAKEAFFMLYNDVILFEQDILTVRSKNESLSI